MLILWPPENWQVMRRTGCGGRSRGGQRSLLYVGFTLPVLLVIRLGCCGWGFSWGRVRLPFVWCVVGLCRLCSYQGRLRPARIGEHMFAESPPCLQVFLAMLTLWHTIDAVLVRVIVFGLIRVNGDKLFVFKCQVLS